MLKSVGQHIWSSCRRPAKHPSRQEPQEMGSVFALSLLWQHSVIEIAAGSLFSVLTAHCDGVQPSALAPSMS